MADVIKSTLRSSYDSLDRIVTAIGQPVRLAVDAFGASTDHTRLSRYHHRIRDTFVRHQPAIKVEEYIGTGGFADVFRAQSEYDGVKDFAIKILRRDLMRRGAARDGNEEEMRIKDVKKRFSNEAYTQWHLSQSLSRRVAESVVRVYDHGEFDSREGFRFILMERMGSTLRDFVEDPTNYADDYDLLMYKSVLMTKVADIVANVHSEGVFHRDIKPENILFPTGDDSGEEAVPESPAKRTARNIRVKLADFGTVRWIKSYTDKYDGVIIGSQFYMSPEQIFHPGRLDPRTDIYSFGVVCFELLYGRHPKGVDRTTPRLLEKLARKKPEHPRPPKGFEPLDKIIHTCMADLGDRYQTMGEVVSRLREFNAHLVGTSGPYPPGSARGGITREEKDADGNHG